MVLSFAETSTSVTGTTVMATVQVTSTTAAEAAVVRSVMLTHFSAAESVAQLLKTVLVEVGTTVLSIPVQPVLPQPGGNANVVVESVLQLGGTLSDFDAEFQSLFSSALATALGVPASTITLTFSQSASDVYLTVQVVASSSATAAVVQVGLQAYVGSPQVASLLIETMYTPSPPLTPPVPPSSPPPTMRGSSIEVSPPDAHE